MQTSPDFGTRRVFFMHVAKTGGISFAHLLRSAFRPEEICPPPSGGGFWRHDPADVAHYRLFIGHFGSDFIDAVDGGGYKITIVRDPRQRVVSLYDFWRSIPPEWSESLHEDDFDAPAFARSMSFSEFLETKNVMVWPSFTNAMARQLVGTDYHKLEVDECAAQTEAQKRLSRFDLVLTTEELSRAQPHLARKWDLPVPSESTLHMNRTYDPAHHDSSRTRPSEADLEKIDRLNRVDTFLYKMVAQRETQWDDSSDPVEPEASLWSKLKSILPRRAAST